MKILFDLDDLWEGHHPEIWHGEPKFEALLELKQRVPQLKVTLFASPGLCSQQYLKYVNKHDWIEIGMHGWYHTAKECDHWGTATAQTCLDLAVEMGVFVPMFRPPQWAGSEGLSKVLLRHNWIYAGHHQQQETFDFHNSGGRVYLADTPEIYPGLVDGHVLKRHGHLTAGIPNSIDVMLDIWSEEFKDHEFEFISKYVTDKYENSGDRE